MHLYAVRFVSDVRSLKLSLFVSSLSTFTIEQRWFRNHIGIVNFLYLLFSLIIFDHKLPCSRDKFSNHTQPCKQFAIASLHAQVAVLALHDAKIGSINS